MAAETRPRCLYDVLGVPRDASPADIRSAYKRRALQLHPDKVAASGSTSAADATAAFQELSHAYEVLSDLKERAYYDSHRTQILFSDQSSKSHRSSSPFDLDLFSFFSTSAFSGFSDSGRGFYKVYGDVFGKIYSQELWFAEKFDLGPNAVALAPLMGNLDSPYAQVTAFYNYWLGFCTVMDFCWVDEYDSSMGPNRRARRIMEEENKKVRKKARREYNDAVRGLAAFVKKRDKRVVDMMVKRNLEEEKRRAEERERKKAEERKKMEQARAYVEPDWAKVDEEEAGIGFDGEEDGDDESRKKKSAHELFCVVCSKKFKSEKQWKNHEQSKKHRDKVAELKMAFEEENEVLEDGDTEEVHVGFDYEPQKESEDSDAVDELCGELRDDLDLHDGKGDNDDLGRGAQKMVSDDESSILEAMVSGHKNRKSDNLGDEEASPRNIDHFDDEQSSTTYSARRRGRRNRASRRDPEDDYEPVRAEISKNQREETKFPFQENKDNNEMERSSHLSEEVATQSKAEHSTRKNQKLKKNRVDVKRTRMKDATADPKNYAEVEKQKVNSKEPGLACETCGKSFESRNKLFAHLGDTGHAMLKPRKMGSAR